MRSDTSDPRDKGGHLPKSHRPKRNVSERSLDHKLQFHILKTLCKAIDEGKSVQEAREISWRKGK